jgi:hypothetical protein
MGMNFKALNNYETLLIKWISFPFDTLEIDAAIQSPSKLSFEVLSSTVLISAFFLQVFFVAYCFCGIFK